MFKLEVTEMSRPNRMVWADGMPFGLFTGTRTYLLTEKGNDACTFAMTEVYAGPLSGLICKSIPNITDAFNEFAAGLKSGAES